jgi:endonuclease III
MNRHSRRSFFERLQAQNPHPTTELLYHSHFELLIAVILSAQTTDVRVNLCTPALFAVANTPQAIYDLGESKLKTYIKSIGLFNSKAANIIKACAQLVELHEGEVPQNRKALEALPGVGRKTANVVLNTAFGEATMAVDTHIFRVGNRTGLAPGKTPLAVELGLLKNIPAKFIKDAHHWLILHGRYVCTARKPHCADCIVRDLCDYPKKQ